TARLAAPADAGLGQKRARAGALGLPLPARGDPLRLPARPRPPRPRLSSGQPLVRRRRPELGLLRRPPGPKRSASDYEAGGAGRRPASEQQPPRRFRARPVRRLRLDPDRLRAARPPLLRGRTRSPLL